MALQICKRKKRQEAGALTAVNSEEEVLPVSRVRPLQEGIFEGETEGVENRKEAVRIERENN